MDGADREAEHLGVPVYTGRKSNQPPLMIPCMPCVAKFTTSYTESPLSMERGKKSTKWKTFVFVYHLLFSVIVCLFGFVTFLTSKSECHCGIVCVCVCVINGSCLSLGCPLVIFTSSNQTTPKTVSILHYIMR